MKVKTNRFLAITVLVATLCICLSVFSGCIDTVVKEAGNIVYSINYSRCTACRACVEPCPENAITVFDTEQGPVVVIDSDKCIGCGVCADYCPTDINALEKEHKQ